MSIGALYTFTDARRITGENPNLITYLVRDRQIPHRVIGKTKLFDDNGMAMLREALADYHSKPEPAIAAAASA